MKKLTALLLIATVVLSLTGCRGFRPKKTDGSDSSGTPETAPQIETVYDYADLEKLLNDRAYGWIGGGMDFSRIGSRLYFPNSEYNTSAVLYYDLADGSSGTLAEDGNNPLSGPPDCAPESVVVGVFPPGSDPLEDLDYAGRTAHIYDLKKGTLTVLDPYPDFRPLALHDGVLYGVGDSEADAGKVILADDRGVRIGEIPLPADMYVDRLLPCDAGVYAVVSDAAGEFCELVGVSGQDIFTLHTVAAGGFFDGEAFWYAKAVENGAELRRFDLKANTDTVLGSVASVSHIYFAAGQRLYYCRRLSEAGDIAILYYDFSTSQETEISRDFPALGGW